eukprot:Skav236414  [mRNA]  locus=scaffold4178:137549:146991:- [translate_table: standard]
MMLGQVKVAQIDPHLHLVADKQTVVVPRPAISKQGANKVIELCSGMGCLGYGLEQIGFEVSLRCDHSKPMIDLAQAVHQGAVIHADITSPSFMSTVLSTCPDAGVLAAGVACQPYSSLGDKKHQMDPRALTLPRTLEIGYGFCRDEAGECFHVLSCSIGELQLRARRAWQSRVLTEVARIRPTMEGLPRADITVTMASVSKFASEEQSLLRCALNGTQFTNNVLVHTNAVASNQCSFCQAADSQFHRHWECPFFDDIRLRFPWLMAQQPHLPPCTLNHGWIPGGEVHLPFQAECNRIPDTSDHFELPQCLPSVLDLFLDGGCIHPSEPAIRIATWAVVVSLPSHFAPVSSGGVPGLRQTPLRGEIWAAISSLKLVAHTGIPSRLWIDNQTVWAVLQFWMDTRIYHCQKRRDADLWWLLWEQFQRVAPWITAIVKVAAHCDASAQPTPEEEWAVAGNNAVDAAATRARDHLSAALWQAWQAVFDHLQYSRRLASELHQMLVAIGQKALQARTVQQDIAPVGAQERVLQPLTVDSGLHRLAQLPVEDIPRQYQCDELPHVLHWMGTVVQGPEPIRWLSFHQLLLRYQKATNRFGPQTQAKRQGVTWRAGPGGEDYVHREYVQGLQNFLTGICKATGGPLTIEQRRPPSHVLAFWSGCVKVPCSDTMLDELDTHLREHSHVQPVRRVRDLVQVPSLCST